MKLKVINYDKQFAKGYFVLLKLFELFCVFLVIFGFENLGSFLYNKHNFLQWTISSHLGFWTYGLVSLIIFIVVTFIFGLLLGGLYELIKVWIKGNWRWAQTLSEDKNAKAERLDQQAKLNKIKEIEKLEEDRKEYGYCKGDSIYAKKDVYNHNDIYDGLLCKKGSNYVIKEISDDGEIDVGKEDFTINSVEFKGNFKVIKQQILKKPKLNKQREEEINKK